MTPAFLSTLGELREATYSDKAAIVERLSQSGHPSVRAVLTALLEDRLYFRNSDQKVFIVKSADGDPLDLIDPLSLKSAGSAPADSLTKIGTNNASAAHAADDRGALRACRARTRRCAWTRCGTCCGRWTSDRRAAARAHARGNECRRQEGNRHRPGARRAGRLGHARRVSMRSPRLSHSVSQDVRNRLALLLEKSPDGSFAESDEKVRQAAAAAVADHRPLAHLLFGHRDACSSA